MKDIYLRYGSVIAKLESIYTEDNLSNDGTGTKLGDRIMVVTPSGERLCLMTIPLQYYASVSKIFDTVFETLRREDNNDTVTVIDFKT